MMNIEQKFLKHRDITDELHKLYMDKNKRYNDSFGKTFHRYGPTSLLIRLNDKLTRADELVISGISPLDESLEDTLMDLANYAIMGLIELSQLKPSGLEAELAEMPKREVIEILRELEIAVPKKGTKQDLVDLILKQPRENVEEAMEELFGEPVDDEDLELDDYSEEDIPYEEPCEVEKA